MELYVQGVLMHLCVFVCIRCSCIFTASSTCLVLSRLLPLTCFAASLSSPLSPLEEPIVLALRWAGAASSPVATRGDLVSPPRYQCRDHTVFLSNLKPQTSHPQFVVEILPPTERLWAISLPRVSSMRLDHLALHK